MITSVFKKSTFANYILVVLLLVFFFSFYQFNEVNVAQKVTDIYQKSLIIIVLISSLFLVNFIVKKNGLTKISSFAILFFVLYLALFPSVFGNLKLVLANFFVILAIRRMISLQTLKSPKEKIFDASLWIFVASLFHFWCILFLFCGLYFYNFSCFERLQKLADSVYCYRNGSDNFCTVFNDF